MPRVKVTDSPVNGDPRTVVREVEISPSTCGNGARVCTYPQGECFFGVVNQGAYDALDFTEGWLSERCTWDESLPDGYPQDGVVPSSSLVQLDTDKKADQMPRLDPTEAASTEPTTAPTTAPTPQAKPPRAASILATARTLDQVDDFVNILYSGEHGTAKTTDLAAMANLGPVIVINAEGGLRKGALRRRGINVENIKVLPEKPEDLTFEYLESLHLELKMQLEDEPGSVIGIVWDSITEITAKLLENAVHEAEQKAIRKNEDREKFFIDRSDYGTMASQARLLIRRYRDLPCHFGASCLLKRDADDDGKVVYRPQVIPSLRNDLMGYMDVVVVTSVGEYDGIDEYQGLFKPIGKFRGKDRFGAFPRKLLDPTFDRLLAYINDEMTVDTDPIMQDAKARRLANSGEAIEQLTAAEGEEIDTEVEPESDQPDGD